MIAAVLAACVDASPPPAPLAWERERFREREQARWVAAAAEAADAGRWEEAARIVALERGTFPDAFAPLEARVRAEAPPEVAATLDPPWPRTEAAERARIGRSYAGEAAEARAAAAGATAAQARVILASVAETYVDPIDPAAWQDAGARRLALLREAGGPFAGLPPADTLEAALAAGWPEDLVAVESVDAALGTLDPWTRAIWPAARPAWDAHHAGVTVGIGAALRDTPAGLEVELPQVGGPAWLAGLHAGDLVRAVDGAPVTTFAEAGPRLLGAPGTSVRLDLERGGAALALDVPRAVVPEETVRGWRRDRGGWDVAAAPGIAWVRITAFRPDTDERFDALTEFAAPDVVVLDLRGNEGGDVSAALHVADRFVADGPLVELVGRTVPPALPGPAGELPWNVAAPGHALEGTPVVVLVDERTASAAEIVAAALDARAGAVIVGAPTFGKAASQALRDDSDTGAAWQVTTGRWTVDGRPARVTPDLEVRLSPGEELSVRLLVGERELPPTHPDGSAVPFLSDPGLSEDERLSADPQGSAALSEAARLQAQAR